MLTHDLFAVTNLIVCYYDRVRLFCVFPVFCLLIIMPPPLGEGALREDARLKSDI